MSVSAARSLLLDGSIVNNSYQIVKCIASGSFGMVYLCKHLELNGRLVVVKILAPEIAGDPTALARFHDEINLAYKVQHKNVVRPFEIFNSEGLVGFSMEYIEGGDLSHDIAQEEPMPIEKMVSILIQICNGLTAIHAVGIIHRDIKPENVLLTRTGQVKITDFGIARNTAAERRTQGQTVLGAIDYVSPEYLENNQLDKRCDIYSVGMLAYKMLAKQLPFEGLGVVESIKSRLSSDMPAPSHVRFDCPMELDQIIQKALKRDPNERYQSITEMRDDLRRLSFSLGGKLADVIELFPTSQTGSSMTIGNYDPPKMMPDDVQSYKVSDIPLEGEMVVEDSNVNKRTMPPVRRTNWGAFIGASLVVLLIAIIAGLLVKFPQAGQEALTIVRQLITPEKTVQATASTAQYDEAVVQEQLDILLKSQGSKSAVTRKQKKKASVKVASRSAEGNEVLDQRVSGVTHTVRFKGETLAIIADWYTGDIKNWPKIAKANPQMNPNALELGENFVIPDALAKNKQVFPKEHIRNVLRQVRSSRRK